MDLARFWWSDQAADPGGIGNSLRFRGAQFLSRTAVAPTEGRRWTLSFWVKLSPRNVDDGLVVAAPTFPPQSGGPRITIRRTDTSASGGRVFSGQWNNTNTGGNRTDFNGRRGIRDPGAWYHVVYVADSTLGNTVQRLRCFINNQEDLFDNGQSDVAENDICALQIAGARIDLGACEFPSGTRVFLDGYMADAHFVDGQALAATDFGEFDANDVWIPTEYAGTYGANGFYLDFSDPADIGADRSGNGNDFTPTGFELGNNTSVLWDHMTDHPTQNWSTYNPLVIQNNIPSATLSDANLQALLPASTGNDPIAQATIHTGTTGRYYFEFTIQNLATTVSAVGVATDELFDFDAGVCRYRPDGRLLIQSTRIDGNPTYAAGDVIGVALDNEAGTIEFFRNGTSVRAADSINVFDVAPFYHGRDDDTNVINCGQRPFIYSSCWLRATPNPEPTPMPQSPTGVITSRRLLTLGQTS